ncbi:hypothetical protein M0811_01621 [Anaeramoeba ignava]|uniref:Uncharacterized protein n=1 Tax=Anaeramoeba ignava TaxID=1746090 RepID=A0A9Q0LG11_ANAIG|nr:hypothetical protein M0811_01621 [Anaeramoeba ignava]
MIANKSRKRNEFYSKKEVDKPKSPKHLAGKSHSAFHQKANKIVGSLPVQIAKVESGISFIFEKILVHNKDLNISVDFSEIKKPFLQKRRTYDLKKRFQFFMALLFFLLTVWWRFFY